MVIGTQHTIASNGTASTDYECVGGCAMNTTRESKNETYLTHDDNATLDATSNNITVCGPNVTETFGQNQTFSTEVGNSTEAASGTGENTTKMTGQNVVTNSTETPLSSTTKDEEGGDGNGNESDTSTETIKTTSETIPTTWTTTIETTPDPIAEACSNGDVDK